jgi:hypothetical protein
MRCAQSIKSRVLNNHNLLVSLLNTDAYDTNRPHRHRLRRFSLLSKSADVYSSWSGFGQVTSGKRVARGGSPPQSVAIMGGSPVGVEVGQEARSRHRGKPQIAKASPSPSLSNPTRPCLINSICPPRTTYSCPATASWCRCNRHGSCSMTATRRPSYPT